MMKAIVAMAVLVALLAPAAEASHFRYGSIRWQQAPDKTPGLFNVEFNMEVAYRRSWATGQDMDVDVGSYLDLGTDYNFNFGDGSITYLDSILITVSDDFPADLIMGLFNAFHEYEPGNNNDNTYDAIYTACCRLEAITEANPNGLNNNPKGDWNIQIQVDVAAPGKKSPTASAMPMIEFGNVGIQTVLMEALPSVLGDTLIWSFPSKKRFDGKGTNGDQPNTDLNKYNIDSATGVISWDVTGENLGLYCTQVLVSSSSAPNVEVPIDFFILLSPVKALCVNECDDPGMVGTEVTDSENEECDMGAPADLCSGTCVSDTPGNLGYDACIENIVPVVIAPLLISQVLDTDVDFDISFGPNPIREIYQDLKLTTGNMPSAAEFTWDPQSGDTGNGHVHISKSQTTVPVQFLMCFMANDGYVYGPPTCTKINIARPPPPPVIVQSRTETIQNQAVPCFSANLDDSVFEGLDLSVLSIIVVGGAPECVDVSPSGNGRSVSVCMTAECTPEPREFEICFAGTDGFTYGPQSCTDIEILPTPPYNCYEAFGTDYQACCKDSRCFWDQDGYDESRLNVNLGTQGCFNFQSCGQMDNAKIACAGHELCHVVADTKCISTPFEARPLTAANPLGDVCRDYSKKACRGNDGRKTFEGHKCEWDPLNSFCTELGGARLPQAVYRNVAGFPLRQPVNGQYEKLAHGAPAVAHG